jgi:hypothetical protein
MPDLSDDIAQQAVEPVTSAADGQSATGRAIGEIVQADQYVAGKTAAKKRRRGIRFAKIINPGALSDGGQGPGIGGFDSPGGGY